MKRLTFARKILCTAALLCTAVWSAQAVNIVNNPGFETGSFSGWTHSDPNNPTNDNIGSDPQFAHSGTYHANLGATPNPGSLSQSLTTVAGQFYNLSFWLANDITAGLGPGNSFQVFWNGGLVFALTNASPFPYTQAGASNLLATSGSTLLEFRYRHDNDFWRLDDVSVSVPEAFSTIWLALPAFGALGMLHFSRTRGRKGLIQA